MKQGFARNRVGSFRLSNAGNKTKRSMSRLNLRSPLTLILISLAVASIALTFVVSASRKASGSKLPSVIERERDARAGGPKLNTSTGLNLLSPVGPNITAVKSHSPAGPFHLGDTINYSTTISNGGTDATGVTFTDTIDSNTTLVAVRCQSRRLR
jgi:uncharacterized repeat protein (TIGR01451 family)